MSIISLLSEQVSNTSSTTVHESPEFNLWKSLSFLHDCSLQFCNLLTLRVALIKFSPDVNPCVLYLVHVGRHGWHKINYLFKSRFYIYAVQHCHPCSERMIVNLRNHNILSTESRSVDSSIQITIENVKVLFASE